MLRLKVVFDQEGTPTYALDLANVIMVTIEDYKNSLTDNRSPLTYAKSGVYNFNNEDVCSWYDFTKMIAVYAPNVISNRVIAMSFLAL